MATVITKEKKATSSVGPLPALKANGHGVSDSFLEEVRSFPGGEGVDYCIQCGTCAGSCPNASNMDYTPRQLIAMVSLENSSPQV